MGRNAREAIEVDDAVNEVLPASESVLYFVQACSKYLRGGAVHNSIGHFAIRFK